MRVDCSMERLDASTICHVGALSFHQAMFHLSKVACSNGLEQRHQEVSASRDCKNADADSGGESQTGFRFAKISAENETRKRKGDGGGAGTPGRAAGSWYFGASERAQEFFGVCLFAAAVSEALFWGGIQDP